MPTVGGGLDGGTAVRPLFFPDFRHAGLDHAAVEPEAFGGDAVQVFFFGQVKHVDQIAVPLVVLVGFDDEILRAFELVFDPFLRALAGQGADLRRVDAVEAQALDDPDLNVKLAGSLQTLKRVSKK